MGCGIAPAVRAKEPVVRYVRDRPGVGNRHISELRRLERQRDRQLSC